MASGPERPATAAVDGASHEGGSEDVTQGDGQWPVADLYYVTADDENAHAGETVVAVAQEPATRRRLPPNVGVGGLLAALGVVAALVLGAVLLTVGDDDPTASAQGPTPSETTTPPAETAPPTPVAAKVEVVDVVGISLAEATEMLQQGRLDVRVTRSPSDRARGVVLSQAPSAGSRVAPGTVVALVTSQGEAGQTPETVEVPSVVGLRAAEALAAIRAAGLEGRVRQVPSSRQRGTVVDQRPAQGSEVADGSTIRLNVAKPVAQPTRVVVPDVVGSSAAAARSELRALGMRVTTTAVASQEPAGTVLSQTPVAGAKVRKGSRVTLTVSTGPARVDVPDVTGLDEAAARGELERAGFDVRVVDETSADPAQDGLVVRQTPAGGSSAEDGATVTIVVGRLG